MASAFLLIARFRKVRRVKLSKSIWEVNQIDARREIPRESEISAFYIRRSGNRQQLMWLGVLG